MLTAKGLNIETMIAFDQIWSKKNHDCVKNQSPKYQQFGNVAHDNYIKIRRSPTTATLVSLPYRFDPSRAVVTLLTIDVIISTINIIDELWYVCHQAEQKASMDQLLTDYFINLVVDGLTGPWFCDSHQDDLDCPEKVWWRLIFIQT